MTTTFIHVYILGNEKPQLKDVNNTVVIKCAANWKQLGINLNVSGDILNIIETNNPNDCESCCSEMLRTWLDSTPNATWGILLDAVDKTVGRL